MANTEKPNVQKPPPAKRAIRKPPIPKQTTYSTTRPTTRKPPTTKPTSNTTAKNPTDQKPATAKPTSTTTTPASTSSNILQPYFPMTTLPIVATQITDNADAILDNLCQLADVIDVIEARHEGRNKQFRVFLDLCFDAIEELLDKADAETRERVGPRYEEMLDIILNW